MRIFLSHLLVLILLNMDVSAMTKPVNVRSYNMSYPGVAGTGAYGYTVLYRDHYLGTEPQGEGYGSHPGVDIACPHGETVYAIAAGTVYAVRNDPWRHDQQVADWGNYIIIKHNPGDIDGITEPVYSIYAHLHSANVALSETVSEGQVIGLSGHSGTWSTELNRFQPHLHFQIDRDVRLDNGAPIAGGHPFWESTPAVNTPDNDHYVELNTINPMPLLQMEQHVPCYVPVGFFTEYNGRYHWESGSDGNPLTGISQEFRTAYDNFFKAQSPKTALGFPWGNGIGGQGIHEVNGMYIQDLFGPNNGLSHPYAALIRGPNGVKLLKEGFWDYWMKHVGWENYGRPLSDEGPKPPHLLFTLMEYTIAQRFINNEGTTRYLLWGEGANPIILPVTEDGIPLDMSYTIFRRYGLNRSAFVNGAPAAADGVYNSGIRVAEFEEPVELINGQTYAGFTAFFGGSERTIGAFTVTSDMVINTELGLAISDWNVTPSPAQSGEQVSITVRLTNLDTTTPLTITQMRLELLDPNGGEVGHQSIYDASFTPGGFIDITLDVQTELSGMHVARIRGYMFAVWETYDAIDVPVGNSSAPTADFAANVTSGLTPLTIQFTDLSTGGPTDWHWDFTGGATSTDQNPSHTYTAAGAYDVSLLVNNPYGSNFINKSSYIFVLAPIIADFSTDITVGYAPSEIQFTDQSSGAPTTWYWDFGDGQTSSEQNPSHTYSSPGVYNVSFTAGHDMDSDTLVQTGFITVLGGCEGNGAYHFNGIDQYLTVGVMVGGVLGNETTVEAWVNLEVNNVEQNIYSYWNVAQHKMFNLHVNANGQLVGERYGATPSAATSGSNILLTNQWYYVAMVSKAGEPTKVYINGELAGTSPDVLVTPNVTDALLGTMGCQNYDGACINFLRGSIDEVRVSKVARTAAEIASYYSTANAMTVDGNTLTLWHMNGNAGTPEKMAGEETGLPRNLSERNSPLATGGFTDCLPLSVDFSVDITSGVAPLVVEFTDRSTGGPHTWSWNFGDGGISCCATQNPVHIYASPGVYSVRLEADNGAGSTFLVKPDYIIVSAPVCVGNGGYYLDGVNQSLELASVPYSPYTDPITVELWAKTSVDGMLFCATKLGDGVDALRNFIRIEVWNHTASVVVAWERDNFHRSISFSGTTVLTDDKWHLYSLVVENKTVATAKLYIDGAYEASREHASETYDMDDLSGAWLIGCNRNWDSSSSPRNTFFDGSVDECRLSRIARSGQDILNTYLVGDEMAVDAGTVALWHMNGDGGSAGKIDNSQGNGALDLVEQNGPIDALTNAYRLAPDSWSTSTPDMFL
jgi:PKD repeat protein